MCANYIWGTGGLAREIFGWMQHENCEFLGNLQGFIQPHPVSFEQVFGQSVLHPSQVLSDANIVVAVGCGKAREEIFQEMDANGFKNQSYISRDCSLGQNITFGKGTIVCPGSTISSNVSIGDGCFVNCQSGIGHDSVVGDFCTLLGFCAVNGDCILGDKVTVGSGSILHPNIKVGNGATIGIGAVVIKNVREQKVVLGNPAKAIR